MVWTFPLFSYSKHVYNSDYNLTEVRKRVNKPENFMLNKIQVTFSPKIKV